MIFKRSFIQFDGEGETANARQRATGGHAAALVSGICLRKKPDSPYADKDGYVPFDKMVDYSSGRCDGCTSWSQLDTQQMISMVQDNPTTLYIYSESADIAAVAKAASAGSLPSRSALERVLLERNRLSEILAKVGS
ncbi:hypothetical protein HFO55_03490 [Rhizobium leguminosarum]|nr:hypothetical protein [Rhizobium leguminosarum]MBY5573602.1 hypothetical protein [Rhizobium leguminosarum]